MKMLKGQFGRMGIGLMGLSGHYGPGLKDEKAIEFIHDAVSQGVRIFDTADIYGRTDSAAEGETGHNEKLLGQAWPRSGIQREDLFIGTKCGLIPQVWSVNVTPEHIRESCMRSLQNLKTSYIDLYYLHRLPVTYDELAPCLEVLAELICEGKIHHVGLSEAQPQFIRYVHAYFEAAKQPHALLAVQSELSLFSPHTLYDGVIETCRHLNLAFVPYSPLCRGLLTESVQETAIVANGDVRPLLPRFQGENFKKNLRIRDQLAELARHKKCSLPQLALAWVMAQGDFVFPIPGCSHIKRLTENLGALQVRLSAEDLQRIQGIVPKNGAYGDRYPEIIRQIQNLPVSDYYSTTTS